MSRYIDAERFRKEITVDKYGHIETTITKLNIAIEHSTVDAVKVVRCKDCVHYRESYKYGSGDCIYCNRHIFVVEDDYCSCGVRREVTE